MSTFAARLQEVKAERGYTLKQMAQLCMVSWPTMQRWAAGKTQPGLLTQVSALTCLRAQPEVWPYCKRCGYPHEPGKCTR